MSIVPLDSLSGLKQTRRSLTREFKLSLVEWYYNNSKNILQTASKFKVNRKHLRNWVAGEENIRKQKSKSKNIRGRKAQYSLLEEELLRQFHEQINLGKGIKGWWFLSKEKKMMLEKFWTVTNLKYSNSWFSGFCRRNKL